jgi:phosphatidylethanolamine-binding protein (PEBP) family uncharacterized protein
MHVRQQTEKTICDVIESALRHSMMTALIMNADDGADTIPNLIWEDVQENTQPFALILTP